jgi:integral membrane protein
MMSVYSSNQRNMNQKLLQLRWLRWASLAEGMTLILLVCLAVPVKRLAGMPEFVTVLGPLHGAAFLIYLAIVMWASKVNLLTASEVSKLMVAAFIPFGAFFLAGLFRRKSASMR